MKAKVRHAEGEDLTLDWIAHMAFVRRLKWSTIKGKIGHVNSTHVQRGWVRRWTGTNG